jgi:hypothetical protein
MVIIAADVNECHDGTYNCSQNAQCNDEKCGYSCSCQIGYFMEDDNYTCARKLEVRVALLRYNAVLNLSTSSLIVVFLGGFGMVHTHTNEADVSGAIYCNNIKAGTSYTVMIGTFKLQHCL